MKIRDATQVIGMLERGDLAAALTEKLQEVIDAVRDAAGPKTTAKGSLTLRIDVAVQGVQITLEGDIASKTPKIKRAATVYFLSPDGSISTEHPQQAEMFPRASEKLTRAAE